MENSFIKIQKNVKFNSILLNNLRFSGHYTSLNGSSLNIDFFYGTLQILNCTFQNNKASDYGGSIYIYNSTEIVIKNSLFLSNEASQGGSIYYDHSSLDYDESFFVLKSNIFIKNKAEFSGGALMFYDKVPLNIVQENSFNENTAGSYGNNTASEAKRIFLNYQIEDYNISQNRQLLTLRIPSGIKINITLNFTIIDEFHQIVNKSFIELILF